MDSEDEREAEELVMRRRYNPYAYSSDLKLTIKAFNDFRDSLFEKEQYSPNLSCLSVSQLEELFALIEAKNPEFTNQKMQRRRVFAALYQCRKSVSSGVLTDFWCGQVKHNIAFKWIVRALPDLVSAGN